MVIDNVLVNKLLTILLIGIAFVLLESCSFDAPCTNQFCTFGPLPKPSAAVTPATRVVFELPGTMIVYHGFACAQSDKSKTKGVVRLNQQMALPAYATSATVFLNGWEVEYLGGDRHVTGLGTAIDSIRVASNTQFSALHWQAAGALADKNFDDAYQWCYRFTVIAWNPAMLNLVVDHTAGICTGTNAYASTNENQNTSSALSTFASFIQNPIFANTLPVSLLPRGFGMEWSDCRTDHHIRQLAYNMGHPERFIEASKRYAKGTTTTTPVTGPSRVGDGAVSWETSVIFKDDNNRRDFTFGEIISGLTGSDLGVIEPPFSIFPLAEAQGSLSSNGVDRKTFVIANIPYNNAIPVLSGWDVGYLTDDQHVKRVGVWIDNFKYDKNPNQLTGTLRYTLASILKDKDDSPGFYARHKVTILGFQKTTGRVVSQPK